MLATVCWQLATAPALAVNIVVSTVDSRLQRVTNCPVVLSPLGGGRVNTTNAVTGLKMTNVTDYAGITVFSNVVVGIYSLTVYVNWSGTSYTLNVPDTNLTFTAAQLATNVVSIDSLAAYTIGQANNMFIHVTNGLGYGTVLSNLTILGTFSGPGITDVANLTAVQNVSNKTFLLTTNLGGVVSNAELKDVFGTINGGATITAGTLSGTVGLLTNGTFELPIITNATLYAIAGYLDGLAMGNVTLTNASFPGTGSLSLALGSGADAAGDFSIAIGAGASASNANTIAIGVAAVATNQATVAMGSQATAQELASTAIGHHSAAQRRYGTALGALAIAGGSNSLAMGYNATAGGSNSVAIGANATAPDNEQVVIGTSISMVDVGALRANALTNSYFRGTNRFGGGLSYDEGSVSSLATGNNVIQVPTNAFVALSGPVAAWSLCGAYPVWDGATVVFRNASGLTGVIENESGFSSTENQRITTGSGVGVAIEAGQNFCLRYSGGSSRWLLVWPKFPSTLTNLTVTSLTAGSGSVIGGVDVTEDVGAYAEIAYMGKSITLNDTENEIQFSVPLRGSGEFLTNVVCNSQYATFPTNTVSTTPTLSLGEFRVWNSNGLALWVSWKTGASVQSKQLAP